MTNPSAGNAAYNILTAPEFKAGSLSTLNVLISWDTKDYTNTGSLRTPAQPISINALAGAVNNGDGTFTVASTVPIPAGVTSGAVAIEGHPAAQSVPGGAYDLRVPVTGVVQKLPRRDPTPPHGRGLRHEVQAVPRGTKPARRQSQQQHSALCHLSQCKRLGHNPSPCFRCRDGWQGGRSHRF